MSSNFHIAQTKHAVSLLDQPHGNTTIDEDNKTEKETYLDLCLKLDNAKKTKGKEPHPWPTDPRSGKVLKSKGFIRFHCKERRASVRTGNTCSNNYEEHDIEKCPSPSCCCIYNWYGTEDDYIHMMAVNAVAEDEGEEETINSQAQSAAWLDKQTSLNHLHRD